MTKPTAEEALEWLYGSVFELFDNPSKFDDYLLNINGRQYDGETPLEAIRNAMKGESDD